MLHPTAQQQAMFCYLTIPRPARGTGTQARLAPALPPRGQGASRRPGSAAELGDGTARRSLAGREQGGGAGAAGAGRARAQEAAAVARWDCCRAAGPVSAAGPAGGRAGSEGAREQVSKGGCAAERATCARAPHLPPQRSYSAAVPVRLLWSECPPARPRTPHPRFRTPPTPVSPQPQSSPFLRAAATPPAPRHARAIVSRSWARRDPPYSLSAAPSLRSQSRRVPARSPAFPSRWW